MNINIKSGSEQESMRKGGQILAKILIELKERSVPGVTRKELDELARRLCLKYGVKPSFLGYGGYPAALCVSVNNEVVHGLPTEQKIESGDLLSLDMGVEFEGFHTDSAVSFLVGSPSPEAQGTLSESEIDMIQGLIQTGQQSFYAGVDLIKNGVRLGDVSAKIQEVAEAKGYGVVRMLVGHGIGRSVHEEPHVPNYGEPGTGPVLKTGMTIAIEPMLTMDGSVDVVLEDDKWTYTTRTGALATHFEHTVLVTDNGFEVLTELR
jgi:methionyl aminopeptidase